MGWQPILDYHPTLARQYCSYTLLPSTTALPAIMQFGKSVGTAYSTFPTTNIDDLFVLVIFCSDCSVTFLFSLPVTNHSWLRACPANPIYHSGAFIINVKGPCVPVFLLRIQWGAKSFHPCLHNSCKRANRNFVF